MKHWLIRQDLTCQNRVRETIEKVPRSRLVFSCLTGSHAYGTSDENSDIDIRGVFMPPREYVLGVSSQIEQIEGPEDTVLYALPKFLKLAGNCNPNIIELLFIPEDNVIQSNWKWKEIADHRSIFVSKKARNTFSGYASQQLHRIKSHRRYLLDPPDHQPTRSEFGLPDERRLVNKTAMGALNWLVAKRLGELSLAHPLRAQLESEPVTQDWMGIIQSTRSMEALHTILEGEIPDEVLAVVDRERAYDLAARTWANYKSWEAGRNPARAELEKKYGFDTKHAMQLVRLIKEGQELLSTGHITLPCPYAEELMDIKGGCLTYDGLIDLYGDLDHQFNWWYNESTLPTNTDWSAIDELAIQLMFGGRI
jgi:predicted nucleotidyltransferase